MSSSINANIPAWSGFGQWGSVHIWDDEVRLTANADTTADDGERRPCPAHGPLDENGGCAGCVADDRATDAWEGN